MIDSFFLKMTIGDISFSYHGFFISYLVVLAEFSAFLFLYVFSIKTINRSLKVETRYKDVLSIVTYSLFPNVFALFSIFLVEIIIFGGYLFSINPPPTIIKPVLAYTLISLEILLFIWSIFILAFGFYTLTKIKFYSIITSILFFVLLLIVLLLTPYNIL